MTTPSNLPPAARRQVKEANRMIAAMHAPAGEPKPAPAAAPAPIVNVEPFDPNAPAPTAAPVTAQASPPPPPVEDFQQKYNVLQGKYNAEISRLNGSAQALLEENRRLLEQINSRPAAPAAPAAPPVNPLDKVITAKEREDFGEELIGLMSRIAEAKSGSEIARLNQELTNLKSSMRVTVQEVVENKQAKVYEALNRDVKDWLVINNSQQFLDWLAVRDIMSGTVRSVALKNAFEAGDAHRVVGIFKRFVEEDSRGRSTAAAPASAMVDPATLIAPAAGRGSAGEAPAGQSGRIWSEQEINDFYSRVQRNRISPEEKKSTEAEIHKAMIEGRIRPAHDYRALSNSA